MRAATVTEPRLSSSVEDFNPRSPCGLRHELIMAETGKAEISIPAAHAGCDFAGIVIKKFAV